MSTTHYKRQGIPWTGCDLRVTEGLATTYHYNATTCEACRRAVQEASARALERQERERAALVSETAARLQGAP